MCAPNASKEGRLTYGYPPSRFPPAPYAVYESLRAAPAELLPLPAKLIHYWPRDVEPGNAVLKLDVPPIRHAAPWGHSAQRTVRRGRRGVPSRLTPAASSVRARRNGRWR